MTAEKIQRKKEIAGIKEQLARCEIGDSFICARKFQPQMHVMALYASMAVSTSMVDPLTIKVTRTA